MHQSPLGSTWLSPKAWIGPLLVAAAAIAMLVWTWGTWPDLLIDSGRELYVPWRIGAGDALYREIAYFNGLFSPHLNALWFFLFGASLRTLVCCNLAITALLLMMLYRLLLDITSRFAAAAAALTFVIAFAFAQYEAIGNSNYIFPYSHEMVHGLALGLGALMCFRGFLHGGRRLWLGGLGGLLGATWLTKPEMFAAASAASIIGLVTAHLAVRRLRKADLAMIGLGSLVLPTTAFAACTIHFGLDVAIPGLLGAWPYVLDSHVRSLPFYQSGMGVHNIQSSLRSMLVWSCAYLALLVPASAVALASGRNSHRRTYLTSAAVLSLTLVALGPFLFRINWPWLARPLPVITTAIVFWSIATLWTKRRSADQACRSRITLCTVLAIYSLALLAKMIFAARLKNYGFVLAMPATLLLVVVLLDWLPAWIHQHGGNGTVMRAASVAAISMALLGLLATTHRFSLHKNIAVGNGSDRFWVGQRGNLVNALLEGIDKNIDANETFVAMPQGVMLNYLSRRINPTPYFNFLPLELTLFGEDRALEALQAKPPDFVFLIHKDTSECGPRFFGRDYANQLMAWVQSHYDRVDLIGSEPFVDNRVGIAVMRKHGEDDR